MDARHKTEEKQDKNAMKHNFKKLIIWHDAIDLCDMVYNYTETLPQKEKYNLISQLERCAVSIPSNISEGSGKRTKNHFAEFLTTSLSSCFEIETQLLICQTKKVWKGGTNFDAIEFCTKFTKKDFQF
jgi:four helix bundle protein